ncbi:hypothetical protein CRYUN_Cryun19dG0105900 [Craigia yunnanensis]
MSLDYSLGRLQSGSRIGELYQKLSKLSEITTFCKSYDALASSHESLKRENQSLSIQLEKLKSQLEMEHGNKTYGPNRTAGNSGDGKCDNGNAIFDANDENTFLFEGCDRMLSSDNNSTDEDRVVLEVMEATDGSLTSSDWCSFESNCFLDESSCSSNWWEYW